MVIALAKSLISTDSEIHKSEIRGPKAPSESNDQYAVKGIRRGTGNSQDKRMEFGAGIQREAKPMKCQSCDADIDVSANFCGTCGARLEKVASIETETKSAKAFLKCNSCNAEVELPASFCDMCGAPLGIVPEGKVAVLTQRHSNDASEHLSRALTLAYREEHEATIHEARKALELGLTTSDEVVARVLIGNALPHRDTESQEIEEGGAKSLRTNIEEIEKALLLDAKSGQGFFLDPLNRKAWLSRFQPACILHSRWISNQAGLDQAITYLEGKLKLFEYWPGTHMSLIHFELGNLYKEAGELAVAKASWLRCLDAEPLSEEVEHEQKTREMAKNNLEVLESETAKKQKKVDEATSSDAIQDGWRLLDADNISEALHVAGQAIKTNPDDPEAWALSAQAKFRWGKIEDAIYEYKKAINLKPNEPAYYFNLGSVYESKEQWDDALRQFERASKFEPNATMYRAAIGAMFVKKERCKEAIPILERCVQEDPSDAISQIFLAAAYHDSLIESWWKNPHDGKYYCISKACADEAQATIARARSLRVDDPELVAKIAEAEKLVESLYTREFKGSWVVVVIFGLFCVIPGILWWLVNRRPRYKLNKDIHDIVESGKSDALEGGEVGAYFSLLPPGFKRVAYRLPRFVVWGITIILAPLTFFYSLYDNYIAD